MDFNKNNMKKLITLALIIGATTLTQAQSNLVFNRVLNFSLQPQEVVTVPEGKVWKMEWGIMSGQIQILSTNQPYGTDLTTGNSNGFSVQSKDEPIWLGEGSSIAYSNTNNSNMLSVLEFNVEPISTTTGGSGGGVSADGLIFNQVINYSENAAAFQANGSATWTDTIVIPEGKVWKIMSFSVVGLRSLDNHISDCDGCTAELGNLVAYSRYISGYSPPTNQYPMFINEGAKELKVYNGSNSFNLKVSFTAVEYNIP